MISRSDARLFCKNQQVNLKNKPKIGNLTEKQAPYALAAFFSTKRKVNKKITWKKREADPKQQTQNEQNFIKTRPKCLWQYIEQQKWHKMLQKSHLQNINLQKTIPKNKQISIKTSPKTSNPQIFNKTHNSTKNKRKFAGKSQGWQHWLAVTAKCQPTQNTFEHKLRIHSITLCDISNDWFSCLAFVLLHNTPRRPPNPIF